MLGLSAHAHPATAGLQLFDQHQQFIPGVLRENRAGDVDDVGIKQFDQGKVFQQEPRIAAQATGNAGPESNVGRQQVHAYGFGSEP